MRHWRRHRDLDLGIVAGRREAAAAGPRVNARASEKINRLVEWVRAILDGLEAAYGRTIDQAATLTGRAAGAVHVVGGGARNRLLCHLTANAFDLPVTSGPAEATALGNLLGQARALCETRRRSDPSAPASAWTPRRSDGCPAVGVQEPTSAALPLLEFSGRARPRILRNLWVRRCRIVEPGWCSQGRRREDERTLGNRTDCQHLATRHSSCRSIRLASSTSVPSDCLPRQRTTDVLRPQLAAVLPSAYAADLVIRETETPEAKHRVPLDTVRRPDSRVEAAVVDAPGCAIPIRGGFDRQAIGDDLLGVGFAPEGESLQRRLGRGCHGQVCRAEAHSRVVELVKQEGAVNDACGSGALVPPTHAFAVAGRHSNGRVSRTALPRLSLFGC
jgi:hypothetical protein